MSNTKAFKYLINANKYDKNNFNISLPEGKSSIAVQFGSVIQTSPSWVLTFVRWEIRDLLRTNSSISKTSLATRPPLIVESDCIQLTISDNKGTLTPNMSAVLVETDINYLTAIHPGDFVFVNILNWEKDAKNVVKKVKNLQPINEIDDGFKGFFKIQSVRKVISSDPNTGIKTVLIKIDGFAFTEFNNTIHFNQNLINQADLKNLPLFSSNIASIWANVVTKTGIPSCQDILTILISSFIGYGPPEDLRSVQGMVFSPNSAYLLPNNVGCLLGIINPSSKQEENFVATVAAKDIFLYLFGIQQYDNYAEQNPSVAMNPSNFDKDQTTGFFYTTQICGGQTILKTDYWNQTSLWSILSQYINSPLNELYTCFKLSKFGRVLPTVVFRQIPFTSEDFESQKFGVLDDSSQSIYTTKFLNLPRWKIGSESVYSLDIGVDESARTNFVQYYAGSAFDLQQADTSNETAAHNYVVDSKDVYRSGLRPHIIQNSFAISPAEAVQLAPAWARILGDALIGGQLKLNGTIECVGISDPITIGDNLEFNNVVYHIEQVSHVASINPTNGTKTFRTVLNLSYGVSVNSDIKGTEYSEMRFVEGQIDREVDYSGIKNFDPNQILPGVSESKDVSYRITLDGPNHVENSFVQPSEKNSSSNEGNNE